MGKRPPYASSRVFYLCSPSTPIFTATPSQFTKETIMTNLILCFTFFMKATQSLRTPGSSLTTWTLIQLEVCASRNLTPPPISSDSLSRFLHSVLCPGVLTNMGYNQHFSCTLASDWIQPMAITEYQREMEEWVIYISLRLPPCGVSMV